MREPQRRLPTTPPGWIHPGIIEQERRRQEQNRDDRRPHAPPPEPPGRYEDDPRGNPPSDQGPERGPVDINFEIKGEEKDQ